MMIPEVWAGKITISVNSTLNPVVFLSLLGCDNVLCTHNSEVQRSSVLEEVLMLKQTDRVR